MRIRTEWLLVLALGVLAGCDGDTPSSTAQRPTLLEGSSPPPTPAPPITPQAAQSGDATADPSADSQNDSTPADAPPEPEPMADASESTADREVAEAGVGKKGQGYGGQGSNYIEAAIHAGFTAEQRIILEIQIPKNMQLFKAEHDRAPRSHEEFMKEIVEKNLIQLPPLPRGDVYIYDPKLEQLMVEHHLPGDAAPGDATSK